MSSAVIGPETAKRLLAIYRPDIRLEDVAVLREVLLSGGARLCKYDPNETPDPRAARFGDNAYMVQADNDAELELLGLDPQPERVSQPEAIL